VVGILLVLLALAVAAGWVGWLLHHPGQAWQWVTDRWFSAAAMAVFVAALGVWVAWAGPRAQQRRAEVREDAKQAQAVAERQEAWQRRCRSLLALWPLPKVEDVNPFEIGVFYSRRAEGYRSDQPRPPYVSRALDGELAGLLRTQPLVLVKGQSRAGKSRTAFEVAARELAGWRLVVPKDRAALAALADLDPLPGQGERVLVWLDDLDEYLAVEGVRGLDAGLLGRWARCDPPVKVLATIRWEEYGRLVDTSGELGRNVQDLLNRFAPGATTLPVDFNDPAEQAAIGQLYPNERILGGLAEHLAAAHELVDRLEVGQASVPEGAGLVLAAVDCRRAGLDRPLAKADLAGLLPLYLTKLRPLVPLREGDVDRGLDWATEPVGRTAALLVPDPDSLSDTFRADDPIVDYVERRDGHELAHAGVWEYLLARVSPDETIVMAFTAYTRGEFSVAKAAWLKIAGSGHPDHAPVAAVNLGRLLTEQGDGAGARAAFQQAIDSGHPDAAPMAARNLGLLRADQGDLIGARAAFQQAIDSGHPDQAPAAAINLAMLLEAQGDLIGARAAFQQAIDSGHPDYTPIAVFDFAMLLEDQGDLGGARAAYQQAIDSGHPRQASAAAVSLGRLLTAQGDQAGARAAFQQAIDSGHPDYTPIATVNLGGLLTAQGDQAGARAAYQQAIDSGHQDAAPKAAFNLGVLLTAQGDQAGARAAFQQVIDSGHPDAAPMAAGNLGLLRAEQGDLAGARAAHQQAIDSGHQDAAPAGARNLGLLLEAQGDLGGARAAYQQAIDSGHPDHAPAGAVNLGVLLAKQGDRDGAHAAFQQAIDSGHPDAAPKAAVGLGLLLEAQGDLAGARAAYQQAIDSGHLGVAGAAQQALQNLTEPGHA
jgi:tetratricopeptide (TPR) repeat protein